MPDRPSLDLIYSAILRARVAQLSHCESLDLKAGIVIGFAASMIAQSGDLSRSFFTNAGRGSAALSALLSAWSFWPREFPEVDPGVLRRLYMTSDPTLTKKILADTELERWDEAAGVIAVKAQRLKAAISALSLGTVLLFLGLLIGGT